MARTQASYISSVIVVAPTSTLDPIPDDQSTQLITDLQLKDRFGLTAIVGLWGRPHPRIEIGAGGRLIPVKMTPKGGVLTDKTTLLSDDVTAQMEFQLPVQLRGGLRYLHPMRKTGPEDDPGERFDIEIPAFRCPDCAGSDVVVASGDEFEVESIEVEVESIEVEVEEAECIAPR